MLALMLIDAADPRYGGSPDPDDERRRRWEPMDRRILYPILGSVGCTIVSGATSEPALAYGLTLASVGFCCVAVRAAWPRPRPGGADGDVEDPAAG